MNFKQDLLSVVEDIRREKRAKAEKRIALAKARDSLGGEIFAKYVGWLGVENVADQDFTCQVSMPEIQTNEEEGDYLCFIITVEVGKVLTETQVTAIERGFNDGERYCFEGPKHGVYFDQQHHDCYTTAEKAKEAFLQLVARKVTKG